MDGWGLNFLGVDEIGATSAPSLDDVRAGRGVIKRDMRGAAVEYVQALAGVVVDGSFGSATETAVKKFQSAHDLDADGIVGQKTLAALDKLAGGGTAGVEKADFSTSAPPTSRGSTSPASAPVTSAIARPGATSKAAAAPAATESSSSTTVLAVSLAGAMAAAVGYAWWKRA